MIKKIDCTNMGCPLPVIKTKGALEELPSDGVLDVELNSFASIENVKKFVKNQGLHVEVKTKQDGITTLSIVKRYSCDIEQKSSDKSFYTLIVGSLVSAFLASTCCLAPFLFLVFGVSMSSLSFLSIFAPYQMYFSLIAVLIIIYLWYSYFKRVKTQFVCATSLCKNYKLYLSLGTIFVLILITYPYWVNYILE
jgi:TusA-related sulfurtransferase